MTASVQTAKKRFAAPDATSPFQAALAHAVALFREVAQPIQFGDARDGKLTADQYLREALANAGEHVNAQRLRELAAAIDRAPVTATTWIAMLRTGLRRAIRATRTDAGCALAPPTEGLHQLLGPLGGDPSDEINVVVELSRLGLSPSPGPLEIVALEVLLAVAEAPECFGTVAVPLAQHRAAEAERAARWSQALADVQAAATLADLCAVPAGAGLWRLTYRLADGGDTGIDFGAPGELIARMAAH
jgi:hypothetical protein